MNDDTYIRTAENAAFEALAESASQTRLQHDTIRMRDHRSGINIELFMAAK